LITITQGSGTTTLSCDTAVAGDRLKRITDPGGRFLEHDHNDPGRRTAVRDRSGRTTCYAYDAAGRLGAFAIPPARRSPATPATPTATSSATARVSNTCDELNRLIQITSAGHVKQFEHNALGARSATIYSGT